MKKSEISLIKTKNIFFVFLLLFFNVPTYSQCITGLEESITPFTPTCSGTPQTLSTFFEVGKYAIINVLPNKRYTFYSNLPTDYFTITSNPFGNPTVFTHGLSNISWSSNNYVGTIRAYIHSNSTCVRNGYSEFYLKCEDFFVTCNPPSNLGVQNVTSNSAAFKWNSGSSSNSIYYDTYISTSSLAPDAFTQPTAENIGVLRFFKDNLLPNTSYNYWVRTDCGNIKSSWVSGGNFTTLSALSCNGANYGLFPSATFTPNCGAGVQSISTDSFAGEYCNVNVEFNKEYNFKSSVVSDYITITNESGTEVYASGLSPLTWLSSTFTGVVRYYLHTNSSCGEESNSRIRSIQCGLPCDYTINNFRVTGISQTGATLNWSAFNQTLPANGYDFYYNSTNTPPANTPSGNTLTLNASITGLIANTTYYFWVRLKCALLDGPWVAGSSFITASALGCNVATNGSTFLSEITPNCTGTPNSVNDTAGRFIIVNIIPNRQYTFSSSVPTDYITIAKFFDNTVITSGIAPVTWLSNSNTGKIRFYLHTNAFCGDEGGNRQWSITCAPTCLPPTNLSSLNETNSGATINWVGSNPAPSNGYEYYYTTDTSFEPTSTTTPKGNATISSGNNVISATLAGLSAGSEYQFWVRSNCGAFLGDWTYGGSFETTVLTGGCTGGFNNFYPTTTFSPNCNGSLETIVVNAWAGEFCKVDIASNKQYTFATSVGTDYITIKNEDLSKTLAVGFTPLTLLSNEFSGRVIYYIHTNSACGEQSVDRTRSVACGNVIAPICINPTGFSVSNITGSGATINWLSQTPFPSNGYQYYYNTTNITPTASTSALGHSLVLNASIVGLNGSTTYYYWVRSNCGSSFSNWVSGNSFTTNVAPICNAPTGLSISAISASGATLNWLAASPAPLSGYQYYYNTTNTPPTAATIATGNSTTLSTSVLGLIAGTTYYYWIRSNCESSFSNWISGGSFSTSALSCNIATYGLHPTTTFVPACSGVSETIVIDAWAGEYSNVNIIANKRYTFSSSVATDYITITNASGTTVLASGLAPLVWLSNANIGAIRYFIHANSSCADQQVNRTRSIICANVVVTSCAPPTSLLVNYVTSNSLVFSWTASISNPANYDIYRSNTNTAPVAATTPLGNVTGINGINAGLAPNNTYYYWVRSNCGTSQSVWASVGSITTLPALNCNGSTYGLYPTATFTPACTGISENIVTDCWAGEFSNVNILANKQYSFNSSVAGDYITITNATGTAVLASGIVPLTWLSNTNTGIIRYYLHASSSCTDQNINRTRSITCTNVIIPTCNFPSGLSATGITTTVATLNWLAPNTVPANGYQYYYSINNIAPLADTTPTGNSTTLTANLTGLSSSTVYYCWVRSNCGTNQSTWISGNSFTTSTVPICSSPSSLSVSAITTALATLNWLAPNTVPANGYQYYYSTNNIAPSATTTPTGTSTTLSATLTGLSSNTVYYYWLRSNCGTNQSTWTSGNSFTTLTPVLAINDTCSSSINLLPASNFANGAVNGSLLNATTTAGITPSCQANFSSDVWYKVIVPASGSITLETKAAATNTATDTVLAVFSGNCGTLTQIGCNDDKVANNNLFSLLSVTGQIPGATLYVGVWKFQTDAPTSTTSNFQIAAYGSNLANENFELSGLMVYPNPVKDILNISLDKEITKINIYNLLGQEIIAKSINANESKIDVSNLTSGAYFVKVYADNLVKTVKVVKE